MNGKERFNRWGKHYLRALMRSHQLQLCTNFMDPGLQVYGGSLFKALRDRGDTIFLSLPAPKPSVAQRRSSAPVVSGGYAGSTTAAAPRARVRTPSPDMRTYYAGSGGGCFGPSSSVLVVTPVAGKMQTRQTCVADVRAGDKVRIADGPGGIAEVRCVVRIARPATKRLVSLPGGLTITPGHPVRVNGHWQLPRDLTAKVVENQSGYVYNFILDRCHVLLVDGVECVTWGHGIEGEVVGHMYYGTSHVLRDLERMPGWEQGFVQVEGCFRNAHGQVTGLQGGAHICAPSLDSWDAGIHGIAGTNGPNPLGPRPILAF